MGLTCRRNHGNHVPTRNVALAASYTSSPQTDSRRTIIESLSECAAVSWRRRGSVRNTNGPHTWTDATACLDWIASGLRLGGRTVCWGVNTLRTWRMLDGWRWA